ncbi:splicing regulator RBM11 isoform X3 [Rhea pennata]|uniref:splicing regulator RBM11 isoform X3 n=1 Tax=Rhea pennata TaxID=8795 RepID=UPI002E255617
MSSAGRAGEADRTLFVGNLESRVREEILYELFLQAGPLTKVTICKDKEGKPKSFGFVCFKHTESVPYAIALLNGIRLYGRPIKVQYRLGSSHSSELNSPAHGFENYVDIYSPSYRYQEPYGNPPFPVIPFPVNNNLPQEYSVFQKMNQVANFKSGQSSSEWALPHSSNCKVYQKDESTSKRKREQLSCDSDSSIENDKKKQRECDQKYKKCKAKKKRH